MKNRYWFTILTSLVAALFILSLFPGIVAAQAPGENNGMNFQQTEKIWKDALEALKHSKSKEDQVLKAKDYLEKAINHTISYLNVLKSRTEKSENKGIIPFDVPTNIDALVKELEQLRAKVQSAKSIEELRADNKELKDIYAQIRLETRYDFAILLNNRIDKFVAKSNDVLARLDAAIKNQKSNGKDTSDLEKAEADFKNLMQEAADNQQKTDALLATPNGFGADGTVKDIKGAEAFLKQIDNSQRETIKKLREASRQLLDFVKDFRKLSGGRAVSEGERGERVLASGNRTLVADGSGRALIEGNVSVNLSGINGTLIVSSNANVTTDGTNQTLGNDRVQYKGFTYAIITPPMANENMNIRVAISGNHIDLTATCTATTTTCTAVLHGNGTFSVSGVGKLNVSGEWKRGG